MGIEIERKFLVRDASWRTAAERDYHILQGYLSAEQHLTVRVRVRDDEAFLTLKGATTGVRRAEYEYPIPKTDAEAMLRDLSRDSLIEKRRHIVRDQGRIWEIDVFAGDNQGLVLAEIELADEQQRFSRPNWLGQEVSDDPRYFNANLARHPYRRW